MLLTRQIFICQTDHRQEQQHLDEEEYKCGVCGELYKHETEEPQVWIQCDLCEQWLHCSCEHLSAPHQQILTICVKCITSHK